MRALLGVAVLAMALLTACQDDPPEEKKYTVPTSTQADEAAALRFAPRVWLAEDERFTPMAATAYIRQSVLRFRHENCTETAPVADPVEPAKLGNGDYKHPKDAEPAPPPGVPRMPTLPCAHHSGEEVATNGDAAGFYLDAPDDVQPDDAPPPVYWEYHRDGEDRSAYVYWFFYGRNELRPAGTPAGNRHEGDWERIAVQLTRDEPVAVTFFGHGADPCSMPWREIENQDGHPVVYSAKGSHASYPTPGWHVSGATADWTAQGNLWDTEPHATAVAAEPWYGYRGSWGSPSVLPGFSGPAGPYPGRGLANVFTDSRCDVPARMPAGFEGTWETRDPVEQSPVVPPYHMRVVLGGDRNTVAYRSTWTGANPRLECSGDLRLVDATDRSLELRERITEFGAGNCVPEGTMHLQRDGESLKMTYTSGAATGSAILYRPGAPVPDRAAGIQRYEEFLHALGREDITTVCEIAGPAAKKAEDQGLGPCEETFRITFQMISPEKKRALRTATVDPDRITQPSPTRLEIPAGAVEADATFTSGDLGDYTLELRDGQWFIVD